MKTRRSLLLAAALLAVFHLAANRREAAACSTFKLQVGDELLCGHNLNEGDIGVPGLVFVNKRGVFKLGRTWDELQTRDRANPSGFRWISRYGSVTLNVFAKDCPDGGLNEVGLYIWEMNETAEYPDDDDLPELNKMNWMQYVLDSCATVDDALACARAFAIDGRSWHDFVGDALILNMDGPGAGDISDRLHVYTNEEMRTFLKEMVIPILSVGDGCTVSGEIVGASGRYAVEHLSLAADRLDFTIGLPDQGWEWALVEATAIVEGDRMELSLSGIETERGTFTLYREDG